MVPQTTSGAEDVTRQLLRHVTSVFNALESIQNPPQKTVPRAFSVVPHTIFAPARRFAKATMCQKSSTSTVATFIDTVRWRLNWTFAVVWCAYERVKKLAIFTAQAYSTWSRAFFTCWLTLGSCRHVNRTITCSDCNPPSCFRSQRKPRAGRGSTLVRPHQTPVPRRRKWIIRIGGNLSSCKRDGSRFQVRAVRHFLTMLRVPLPVCRVLAPLWCVASKQTFFLVGSSKCFFKVDKLCGNFLCNLGVECKPQGRGGTWTVHGRSCRPCRERILHVECHVSRHAQFFH